MTQEGSGRKRTLSFRNYTLDLDSRRFYRDDQLVHIGNRCFDALVHLALHAPRFVSGNELAKAVWGPSYDADAISMRRLILDLRHKLQPQEIESSRREGYRLAVDVTTSYQPMESLQPNIEHSDAFVVFLCHASGDKPAVRALYRRLVEDGFRPWLDEEDLLPGQDWERAISAAVRASSVVLVCLSRASVTKEGFVQKEIKYALDVADEKPDGTIFIIPVRLEECDVPARLKRWHWVNWYEDAAYSRLLAALRMRAGQGL